MGKLSEFYVKAISDETSKKELLTILGDRQIEEASDEQLVKVGELAKKLGYDIDLEEAKQFLQGNDVELEDDDLDAVAGGKGSLDRGTGEACNNGIGGVCVPCVCRDGLGTPGV